MREEAQGKPRPAPKKAPTATEEHSHASPLFAHLLPLVFKCFFTFALFGIRKSRENTQPLQRILYFCPFSAYFEPFCTCLRCSHSPEQPRWVQVLPMVLANRERKPTRQEGTRERETKERQRQAHKPTSPQRKGYPPP